MLRGCRAEQPRSLLNGTQRSAKGKAPPRPYAGNHDAPAAQMVGAERCLALRFDQMSLGPRVLPRRRPGPNSSPWASTLPHIVYRWFFLKG